MWEEGIHIYGTPGVYNNFPSIYLPPFFFLPKKKKKKLIIALFLFLNKFSYHWLICDFTFHSLFWGRRYVILFKDNGYQIYNHQWSTYFSVKHSKWVLIWIFLIMVLIWIDIFLSLKTNLKLPSADQVWWISHLNFLKSNCQVRQINNHAKKLCGYYHIKVGW